MSVMNILCKKMFTFLLLGILHITVYYHGNVLHLTAFGVILATLLFLYKLFLKKWSIDKKSLVIFLLLFCPVMLVSLIQILYVSEFVIVKTLINRCLFIVTAFVIVNIVSFERFTLYLRYWGLINVIVMLMAFSFGYIEILDSSNHSYGGVAVSYMGVSFPFVLSNFSDGILRCGGLFGHPNGFGILSAMGFIGVIGSNFSYRAKIFWSVVFLVSFLINESRGSVLFVCIYFMLYNFLGKKINVKYIMKNGLLAILVASIFGSLAYLRDDTGTDFTAGRTELLAGISQKFDNELELVQLLGVGFGNVGNYTLSKFADDIPFDNSYLYTLVELGYIGATLFFISLIIAIYYSYNMTAMRWNVWFPFLAAFGAHSIFESDFVGDKYMYLVVFLFYMISNKCSCKFKT